MYLILFETFIKYFKFLKNSYIDNKTKDTLYIVNEYV